MLQSALLVSSAEKILTESNFVNNKGSYFIKSQLRQVAELLRELSRYFWESLRIELIAYNINLLERNRVNDPGLPPEY